MKNITPKQIESLKNNCNDSIEIRTDEISSLAEKLIEDGDEIENVEEYIFTEIDCSLPFYENTDLDNRGSYHVHIFREI